MSRCCLKTIPFKAAHTYIAHIWLCPPPPGESHCPQCNQEEWLKEFEDARPSNEAERQTTTSPSRTKLLENGRDSETSTSREESSADIDVDDVDLEISSFWLHEVWFQKISGERRSRRWSLLSKINHGSLTCSLSLLGRFYCNGFPRQNISRLFISSCHNPLLCKLTHADICQCQGDF